MIYELSKNEIKSIVISGATLVTNVCFSWSADKGKPFNLASSWGSMTGISKGCGYTDAIVTLTCKGSSGVTLRENTLEYCTINKDATIESTAHAEGKYCFLPVNS